MGFPRKSTTIFWLAIASLVIILGVVVFFRMQPPAGRMDPKTMAHAVSVARLKPESIDVTFTTQATVEATQRVAMNPEIQGVVTRIYVREGQAVRQGQPLIQLKNNRQQAELQASQAGVLAYQQAITSQQAGIAQTQADVAAAKAAATLAEQEFNDYQKLYQEDIISRLELDQKRASLTSAQAQLTAAQRRLDQAKALKQQANAQLKQARANVSSQIASKDETLIRAPFNGRIGQIMVDVGDTVTIAESIISIVGNGGSEIAFDVPERLSQQVAIGQPIMVFQATPLTLDNDKRQNTPLGESSVRFIDPIIDPMTRTFTVKGPLASTSNQPWIDGQFVNAQLVLETHNNAVVLSESALVPQGEKTYVYKVNFGELPKTTKGKRSKTAVFTEVTLGARQAGRVEILKGLSHGDIVVTDGVLKLFDGANIKFNDDEASMSTKNKAVGSNNASTSQTEQ